MDKNQKKIENLRSALDAVSQKINQLENHKRTLELSLKEAELKEERKKFQSNKGSDSQDG